MQETAPGTTTGDTLRQTYDEKIGDDCSNDRYDGIAFAHFAV